MPGTNKLAYVKNSLNFVALHCYMKRFDHSVEQQVSVKCPEYLNHCATLKCDGEVEAIKEKWGWSQFRADTIWRAAT
jgi:hypothetical protein